MFMWLPHISSISICYTLEFKVVNLVEFYGISSILFGKITTILTFGYDEIEMNVYLKSNRIFTRLQVRLHGDFPLNRTCYCYYILLINHRVLKTFQIL